MISYKPIVDGLKEEDIKNHYIDALSYDEKVVVLKEILCGYIVSGGKKIQDPYSLYQRLLAIVGVVEVGLFINMASKIIVGDDDGSCRVI